MYEWLHEKSEGGGRVAIFDATNTTISRRLILAQRARKENVYLLFVESICDDEEVLNRNYDLKLQNDDYKGKPRHVVVYGWMLLMCILILLYELMHV